LGSQLSLLAFDWATAAWGWALLKGIIGLGLVIFVHELGHFLVARFNGVKCEKFYIGFDLFGLKLAKWKRGETEYGIGIFPFGGYVKMLGQEDNPSRLREEVQRAKAAESTGRQTAVEATGDPDFDLKAAERALYDPRSYLAKSVPQRMAIISAGVIMNVIFAFVVAIIAYMIGVKDVAAVVGGVSPGDSAWQNGLKAGDRIVSINDRPVYRFRDIRAAVSLGDIHEGIRMTVDRPGVEKPIELVVQPERGGGLMPTIGVAMPQTPSLVPGAPVYPGTPAARAEKPFHGGDRIVALDDRPVASYHEIGEYLGRQRGQTVQVAVERATGEGGDARKAVERTTIAVGPQPLRELDFSMGMGPIVAVQEDSPAANAGIRPGERIEKIDGAPVGDAMTLSDRLERRLRRDPSVTLTLAANGQRRDVAVELREPNTYRFVAPSDAVLGVPTLGIAYTVSNRVALRPGGAAAKAGLKPGDVIVAATFIPPPKDDLDKKELGVDPEKAAPLLEEQTASFVGEDAATWTYFHEQLQHVLPGTQVQFALKGGRAVSVTPGTAADYFNVERGFNFDLLLVTRRAQSFRDAIQLGTQETWDNLTMVFKMLHKLATRQVSPKLLGGPVEIFKQAAASASQGPGELLVFLTFLSAQLAVLNFLPIPVLDGGHMVFLAYEGLRGKPPSEKVHVGLSYLGLLLILMLMFWVVGLDLGLITR
jgi:regulator of sigma E protease